MNCETFRFQLGNFPCVAIKDDAVIYPIGMFLTNLSREHYEQELRQRGEDPHNIELPYTCLFIDSGRDRVLVDTGGGRRLSSLLEAEGIDANGITTVILSHAHPDHIGGCLQENGKPAFRQARYVMLRKEWDYWMSNPSLAELPVDDSLRKMMLASAQRNLPGIREQLDLLGDPDKEIVPGVRGIAAYGHSPGQMGLEVSSAGQRLLFIADAIVLPLHLDYPDAIGATDHRPDEMVATRIRLLEKAARDQSLVSASHFAFPGLGYVAVKGKRHEWKAVGPAEARGTY